jgi:hypothetical protein
MNRVTSILFMLAIVLPGCGPKPSVSPATDYYYQNPHKNLSSVGRVVIVELANESSYPSASGDITEALFQALQKKQMFSLSVVSRSDPTWQSIQADSTLGRQLGEVRNGQQYTLEQLAITRKILNCNAVLIGSVTQYRPYPHMVMGLRLKLVDLTDSQLLWAAEQIWDTADKTTENRAGLYFKTQMRADFEPLREDLVVVSPIRFMKFVAYEVSETIRNNVRNR